MSHVPVAWSKLLPGYTVPARYRADFFTKVAQPKGFSDAPPTWWLVEKTYCGADVELDDILDWADRHAGRGTYALYVEFKLAEGEVRVELLAGEDPTAPST
jgi:hypothetical protein